MSLRGKETPSFCAGVGEWWRFFSFSTGGGEPVATVCLVSSIGDALGSTFSSTPPGVRSKDWTNRTAVMWRRAPSQPVASVSDAGVGGWWWFFSPSTGGGEPVATVCPVSSVGNAMGSMFSFASPGGGETVATVCVVPSVGGALCRMRGIMGMLQFSGRMEANSCSQ